MTPTAPAERSLYSLARRLASSMERVFFRRVNLLGSSRIPLEGATLFVANHVNFLVDPMVLMAIVPRPLHFLAKAPLFRIPIVGRLLHEIGALPIQRKADKGSDMRRNKETFKACEHALLDDKAIALFPEGLSHDEAHLMPMRTGAARIAGRALVRGVSLSVIPVGLLYTEKVAFRSEMTVIVGAPVSLEGLVFKEGDEPEPVKKLTDRIDAGLKDATINPDTFEDLELMEGLWEMARHRLDLGKEPGNKVRALQVFLERYYRARMEHPTELHRLITRARAYLGFLHNAGLTDSDVRREVIPRLALRFTLVRLLLILLTFPIAAFGWLFHVIPYLLTKYLAHLLASTPNTLASLKILLGLGIYPLLYGLQGWTIFRWAGPIWCAAILLAAPWAGLWYLHYTKLARVFLRTARAFFLLISKGKLKERLQRLRAEVMDALEPLIELYR